jgi:hypothetical protein
VALGFRTGRRGTGAARDKHAVDLPGDVALEAAHDLSLALLPSAVRLELRNPAYGDLVSSEPGRSCTAHGWPPCCLDKVEAMPHHLAGGSLDGSYPAQVGEGRLAP